VGQRRSRPGGGQLPPADQPGMADWCGGESGHGRLRMSGTIRWEQVRHRVDAGDVQSFVDVRRGKMAGMARASRVLPARAGPVMSTLCPPAAATSRRADVFLALVSRKSVRTVTSTSPPRQAGEVGWAASRSGWARRAASELTGITSSRGSGPLRAASLTGTNTRRSPVRRHRGHGQHAAHMAHAAIPAIARLTPAPIPGSRAGFARWLPGPPRQSGRS